MNESEYVQLVSNGKPSGWTIIETPYPSYSFERIDLFFWPKFMEENQIIKYYAAVIYLATIFGIKWYMKDKPAFELRIPLFLWNLSLGLFSIYALCRVLPDSFHYFSTANGNWLDSICLRNSGTIRSSFWGLLFGLSKFVELGDTVFIVLRKRPLQLLQWYHHLATLWVCWTVGPYVEPITRWYGAANYFVHSFMYPYFAFRAIGVKIPNPIANVITTLQLAQMIFGFYINMTSLYLMKSGYDCYRHPNSIQAFNIVYGTFILLFGKLFYDSVIKNGRRNKQKKN